MSAVQGQSTADLYYDATNQTLGSVFPTTIITILYYAANPDTIRTRAGDQIS